MGYSTTFTGELILSKPLTQDQAAYLRAFSDTRRMSRDVKVHKKMKDPLREAVGLPIGDESGYYVGDEGNYLDAAVNYNYHPAGQHGLWCQWVPSPGFSSLVWDGNEKFYQYVDCANYIQTHFLNVFGIEFVDSTVMFQGESDHDAGALVIMNGKVQKVMCI